MSCHGFPLDSALGNFFNLWDIMSRSDETIICLQVLFYRRYVDDTFCLFHTENALFFLLNLHQPPKYMF